MIDIKPGRNFTKAEIEAVSEKDIQITAFADGNLMGGMTYRLDPNIVKPYDVSKLNCIDKARDLLDCLKIKDQSVKKVCVQKVTVDVQIDNDCCCD